MGQRRRVVITGLGVVSPLGCELETYQNALIKGEDGVRELPPRQAERFGMSKACLVRDFKVSNEIEPSALRRLDLASQYVLTATGHAIQDAGWSGEWMRSRCGAVSMGTTLGGMLSGESYLQDRVNGRKHPGKLVDFLSSAASDQISIHYGIHGPNMTVSTACSSSLQSVGFAFDLVRSGVAQFALTGGHDTMAQLTVSGFRSMRRVTKDKIRPFDRNRSGFLLGEGCGILTLEDFEMAQVRGARIYGEILGYGASTDGYHMTAPDPDGAGAARSMTAALQDASFEPEAIDYINAQGTATPHNDRSETRAVRTVFGDYANQCPISSIKGMIGHTLGAAGVLELIGTMLCGRAGYAPPTLNYETPDPDCDLDYVPNKARRGVFRRVLCNSFGFGGNNASIVMGIQ